MIVEIKQGTEENAYDLFVDGKRHIQNESMQLCDNVKQSLLYGVVSADGYTEWDEMADCIRREQEI